jgi:hypothetical protein
MKLLPSATPAAVKRQQLSANTSSSAARTIETEARSAAKFVDRVAPQSRELELREGISLYLVQAWEYYKMSELGSPPSPSPCYVKRGGGGEPAL